MATRVGPAGTLISDDGRALAASNDHHGIASGAASFPRHVLRYGLQHAPIAAPRGSNRLFQAFALYVPGGDSVRPWLHRQRGVEIGEGTWVGVGAIIEPGFPRRVVIGKRVAIGIRAIIIAHFEYKGIDRRTGEEIVADEVSVRIEDDVFIGPAAMILPDVTIVTVPWLPQVASSPVLYLH